MRGEEGRGNFGPTPSNIARKLAREVFDTSKDVFLNNLFVFEGLRRKFQNPENLRAKTCFFDRPRSTHRPTARRVGALPFWCTSEKKVQSLSFEWSGF